MNISQILGVMMVSALLIMTIILFIKMIFKTDKSFYDYQNKPIGTIRLKITATAENNKTTLEVDATEGTTQEMIDKRCIDLMEWKCTTDRAELENKIKGNG